MKRVAEQEWVWKLYCRKARLPLIQLSLFTVYSTLTWGVPVGQRTIHSETNWGQGQGGQDMEPETHVKPIYPLLCPHFHPRNSALPGKYGVTILHVICAKVLVTSIMVSCTFSPNSHQSVSCSQSPLPSCFPQEHLKSSRVPAPELCTEGRDHVNTLVSSFWPGKQSGDGHIWPIWRK